MDSIEAIKAGNGETVNRVKQLQAQLNDLSNQSKQRNDYMEEMKKSNLAG